MSKFLSEYEAMLKQGMSREAIASQLGISVFTLSKRCVTARKQKNFTTDASYVPPDVVHGYEPQRASFHEVVIAMRGEGVKPQPVINSLNPEHFIKAEERFPFLKVGMESKMNAF